MTFCVIFEVIFGPWGHFGDAVGSLLESKNGLDHQRCPKSRPRGATPFSKSPFWRPFGALFSNVFVFFLKKAVLKYVPFFVDFWVALSAPQDGLICNPYTPAQSKHTFPFSHCFQKTASKRGHVGSILGQFSSKIAILSEKIKAKTATQKKLKSKELRPYYRGDPRLPDRAAHVRAVSTRKTETGPFLSPFPGF